MCCECHTVAALQVKGKPQVSSSGVRTRRQAAASGPAVRHTLVPLPVKLMHVLVQLLQEAESTAQEGGKGWRDLMYGIDEGDSDGSEWQGGDSDDCDSTLGLEVAVRSHLCPARDHSFDCSFSSACRFWRRV